MLYLLDTELFFVTCINSLGPVLAFTREIVEHTYIHTCIHTHTLYYYQAMKKNGILPFAPTWMDLEAIMLSEIS